MKRLFLLFVITALSISSVIGQSCSFSNISVTYSGNCSDLQNSIWISVIRQTLPQLTFPDKNTCESERLGWIGSQSNNGCVVHINIGACVGCPTNTSTGSAYDMITNSLNGASFYSQNALNEVENWSKDYIDRMMALNPNYQPTEQTSVVTSDKSYNQSRAQARNQKGLFINSDTFVSVNMREGGFSRISMNGPNNLSDVDRALQYNNFAYLANNANVRRYLEATPHLGALYMANPEDIVALLHREYNAILSKEIPDFNIDAIMQKLQSQRTAAERQAIYDYQEWRANVVDDMIDEIRITLAKSKEHKEFEMSALAENCYNDSDHSWIEHTNYKMINTNDLSDENPIKGLSELIDKLNGQPTNMGFHAELYFNEVTQEYTLAFAGTNDFLDAITDYQLSTGKTPEQFRLAMELADYIINNDIPTNVKFNITGHSLGGGLASVVGLATGCETYTYNAAGVSTKLILDLSLIDRLAKNERCINAFRTEDDVVTSAQEGEIMKPLIIEGTIIHLPIISEVASSIINEYAIQTGDLKELTNPHIEYSRILNSWENEDLASPAIGEKTIINNADEYTGLPIGVKNIQAHFMGPLVQHFFVEESHNASRAKSMIRDLYNAGHGIEEQTQDHILILTD